MGLAFGDVMAGAAGGWGRVATGPPTEPVEDVLVAAVVAGVFCGVCLQAARADRATTQVRTTSLLAIGRLLKRFPHGG